MNPSRLLTQFDRLAEAPDAIPRLRRFILDLAVRGKLVEQASNDEPAAKSANRIQAEKTRLVKQGAVTKEKPFPHIPKDQFPFDIPVKWEWARIGSCALCIEYGTSVKSGQIELGVPVLKMGDIQDGRVLLGGQKTVPRNIEDLPKLFLNRFDLLYNRTNSAELVGKTGIYLGNDGEYTFASYLIRMRFPAGLVSPHYGNLAMNSPYFRETQIVPELKLQCGQANVNGSKLRNMVIPLPPLAEQHRIVAKVLPPLKQFLRVLAANGAELRLAFSDRPSRSLSVSEIKGGADRLEREVEQDDLELTGTFRGVTLDSGSFDLLTDNGLIKGVVDDDLREEDLQRLHDLTNQKCVARLKKTTVRMISGAGKTSYVLLDANRIK